MFWFELFTIHSGGITLGGSSSSVGGGGMGVGTMSGMPDPGRRINRRYMIRQIKKSNTIIMTTYVITL